MKRQPEHVFSFVVAELGTEGSIDGNQRLVLRGQSAHPSLLSSLLVDRFTVVAVAPQANGMLLTRPGPSRFRWSDRTAQAVLLFPSPWLVSCRFVSFRFKGGVEQVVRRRCLLLLLLALGRCPLIIFSPRRKSVSASESGTVGEGRLLGNLASSSLAPCVALGVFYSADVDNLILDLAQGAKYICT